MVKMYLLSKDKNATSVLRCPAPSIKQKPQLPGLSFTIMWSMIRNCYWSKNALEKKQFCRKGVL
jgi:hypothetical protein